MNGRLRLAGQAAAVGVVVALLGLLAWKIAQGESEVTSSLARGGAPLAPAFTLERLDGKGDVSLDSLRGKTLVLNFWASWCGPCKDEMPLLQEGWQRWERKGVVFLGINAKDFRSDARNFVARYSVTYLNLYDGKGSTLGRYGVTAFPETFFIAPDGKAVYRIAGAIADAEELDAGIERALAPA